MGEFRDRMERDLQIRGFSPSTQQCYLARMKAMIRFFMRSPDELTLEDINAYQQHLTRDRKVGWGSFNQSVGAIRFFYVVTLEKDWDIQRIPYQKTGRKLPVVLSCEEVSRLFAAVTNLKHRAMLMTAYAAGLRASEVTHLRVSDIDGQRMLLRYLGRYTHRVAISNHRLVTLDHDHVTFRWNDRARGNPRRLMKLDVQEFCRRFLLHILPSGLMRIRHYGLLANPTRRKHLARCRELLGETRERSDQPAPPASHQRTEQPRGHDSNRCPRCQTGRLIRVGSWTFRARAP